MKRIFALLVAATALGAPGTAADAVTVCPGVGGTRPTYVCVAADLNGSGNTVSPSGGWGCVVLGDPGVCGGGVFKVGTTGLGPGGEVYVAGQRVL